ncbi:MAG: nucleoside diphosphate kinase regulator [Bacteriovorax sp.]|jgi:regulator of nucleoside diphosphate kinase|nr:nucleoside diphosphate kinase regulator [Bacteriovorax sp.]
MKEDVILMTERDYLRIRHILSFQNSSEFENLEIELDRAKIVEEEALPAGLVKMNTKFKFEVITDKKEMIITIVYPEDANFSEGKISVLAPLGSALIGLQVNQEINWMFPDGKIKRLKILEVY